MTDAMTPYAVAMANAENGWRVFPCRPTGETIKGKFYAAKSPIWAGTSGWNWRVKASSDPVKIRSWFEEYPDALMAVAIPDGMTVIDIDRHGDNDGFAYAERENWPTTAEVMGTSVSGLGTHLWYAGESNQSDPAKGFINRRTGGSGYVVTPYLLPPVAEVTEPLPEVYRANVTTKVDADPEALSWLSDGMSSYVQRWIDNLPKALTGNGAVTAYASQLSDMTWNGQSGTRAAFEALQAAWERGEHNTPEPDWPAKSVARMLTADQPHWTDTDTLEVNELAEPVVLSQLGNLMGREFAPLDWVVPGILPEGVTLLVAPPKIGKSWQALDDAMAAATGGLALGSVPVNGKRPVLYVDLESGERRLQSRILQQGHDWTKAEAFSYHLDAATAGEAIRAFFAKHRGQRPFVVLDMLAGILGPKPGNLSPYQHDRSILDPLHAIVASDPGAALLIVHHTRKQESADPMDVVSGTNGYAGAVDTIVILQRPERAERLGNLFVMGRDMDGDSEFQVELSARARWELVGGSPAAAARNAAENQRASRIAKLGEDKKAVLAIVAANSPTTVTTADIEREFHGDHKARVGQHLSELANLGLIVRVERGVYRAKELTGELALASKSRPF